MQSPFVGDGEMAARMCGHDWSTTPLGPVECWPVGLCTTVELMLCSRFPMFLAWGAQLTFLYNDAYIPVLGEKHRWALGARFDQVWAEIWPVLGPLSDDVLRGRASYDEDLLLVMQRRGFAEETYFTFAYSPLRAGDEIGMFCACTETTDRVLAERRLRALRALGEVSVAQPADVQQACESAIRVLAEHRADLPAVLVYLLDEGNRSARLAASTGVVVGTAIAPLEESAVADRDATLWQVITTGRPAVSSGLARRYPGGRSGGPGTVGDAAFDTAVILPLVADTGGGPLGALVAGLSPYLALDDDFRTFVDLVGRQVSSAIGDALAYQAQRRRAEALAELDRTMTVLADISHEFRTPLTLMQGPVAQLRAAAEDPEQRAELDMVHRNGLRLGKLVNSLLEFARTQAGRADVGYEPVDLAAVTAELARVFRSAMERAGLRFEVACDDLGEPVYVDRDMWEKVVLNLLSNALKFTFDGSVRVTVGRADGRAVLRIADTGVGIPPEQMPRLFERFHRVERVRSRSPEGSGIGLALVQDLVGLHQGTISATSTPGTGTTFTVALPFGREHLPRDRVRPASRGTSEIAQAEPFVAEALRWLPDGEAAGSGPDSGPGEHGHVLVVDDDADMRDYLGRLLGRRYRVTVLGEGVAALAAARADAPDLVVSDVMMPGVDGLGLVTTLRADPVTASVPVLLLSARAGPEAVVEGLTAGADDYLLKPFSADELLARVDGHLRLNRERSRERARHRLLAVLGTALDRRTGVAERHEVLVRTLVDEGVVDVARLVTVASDGGRAVRPVAARDGATEDVMSRLDPPAQLIEEVVASGEPRFVEVDEEYLASTSPTAEQRELRERLHLRAVGFLPMITRKRVAGVLAVARGQGSRPFDAGDVALLTDVAERAAGALDNALLLHREQAAHRWLELLQQATSALSAAATPTEVARVTVDQFDRLLGTRSVAIWELRETRTLEALALGDWIERVPADWVTLPIDGSTPAGDAVRRREPVWLDRLADWEREYPNLLDMIQEYGYVTLACLPLLAGQRCLGGLAIGFRAERVIEPAERAAAVTLAEQCALALQRAGLLAAESRARTAAEEIGRVVGALSRAISPVEVGRVVLDHAAELGATSAVVLLRHDEQLDVLVAGPAVIAERLPLAAAHPLAHTARTGKPVWLGAREEAWRGQHFAGVTPDDPSLPAQVTLPLAIGDTVLGAIGLHFGTEVPAFPADVRAAALTLAEQCAQALDRARLQQAEHEIADVLQRSLLPRDLPALARIDAAARYLPGAGASRSGGDWYELLPVGEHRIALAVGDVVGQGPTAAAVMGQLRSALAGYLLDGHSPAAALERLDRFARRVPGAAVSTCACMLLDWETGELCWSRAGHLPAVRVGEQGARLLDDAGGTALGVPGRPSYREGATTLRPGETVLLYTDGLVERRGEIVDDGMDRLLAAAGDPATDRDGVASLVAGLVPRMLDDVGPADDVALVAVRLVPAPLHGRLPARPVVLRRLRHAVSGWARAAGLSEEATADLQFAIGEAAANAVEHAYPDGGGEFDHEVTRLADGGVEVRVSDRGRWRPVPLDPGFRGRGLRVIETLAEDVSVTGGSDGTVVRFRMPPPAPAHRATPKATAGGALDSPDTSTTAQDDPADPWVLAVRGDLDLEGTAAVRARLLGRVAGQGPVVVDLCGVGYVSSAGVGLLAEADAVARAHRCALSLRVASASPAARVLRLTGLADVLTVMTVPAPTGGGGD